MHIRVIYQILVVIFVVMINGCTSPHSLETQPANESVESVNVDQQLNLDPWWLQFEQPELTLLITQVLSRNNDLILATLTLRKARLQAGLLQDGRYPQLSANLGSSMSRPIDNGTSSKNFQAKLSVSYEVDLWGKLSAEIDSAEWAAMASVEDRESTAQSLVSTTAILYWQLGYLNQRIELSTRSIEHSQKTLLLTQAQYNAGAVEKLNVLEAQRNFAGQEASHSQLVQQLKEAENALAILMNKKPEDTKVKISTLPNTELPDIAVGLKSELLIRRPDVKSSLYQLRSALASKEATSRSYFPSLSLTGSVGESTSDLKELLRNPVGSLGVGLVLPFLQWNQMQLNKQVTDIDYQTAIVNYRKTLYAAFEDVDNVLSAKQQLAYQREKLQLQYKASVEAEAIYESQYRNGAIGIQDWINAQENLRAAESMLLENRYNQFTTLAALYQAIGGRDTLDIDIVNSL